MDKVLLATIIVFATKPENEAQSLLRSKSETELRQLFTNLLKGYMNDKNSSTLREKITLEIAKYESTDKKLGYDGFKKSGNINTVAEVKPKNVDTENNKLIKTPQKHNGSGSFNDYTFARFEKDKKENPNILISGFINGALIFVIEFPFAFPDFIAKLEKQLKKKYPEGDKTGQYLRGASFTFKDYENCTELKLVYINPTELKNNKDNFSKSFYKFLERLTVQP